MDEKLDNAIGKDIFHRFLNQESIHELAEDYSTNYLMIEEVLRQEIIKKLDKLEKTIESKELSLRYFTRNS